MDDIASWLEYDLNSRRYITVVEDGAGAATTQTLVTRIPVPLVEIAAIVLPFPMRILALLAKQQGAAAPAGGSGNASILRVPKASVAGIDFGATGWEPEVVYAVNPKQPTMYRPLATFHEELLLHKLTELDRLLNALGAKEYEISHVRRRGRQGGAGFDFGSRFAGGGSASRNAMSERRWSGTSDGHEPSLPDGLCWYSGEREWQNLVESRTHGSRRKFAFSVRHDEDFGVDARLAASVEAAKLKIGGRYTSVDQVEFAVSGTF